MSDEEPIVGTSDPTLADLKIYGELESAVPKPKIVSDDLAEKRGLEEIERLGVERAGLKEYYTLRKHWSWFSMILLGSMVFFQFFVTFCIGLKWFDFKGNDAFVKIVIGENFLQIVGIALIVVKFLFPIKSDKESKKETGSSRSDPSGMKPREDAKT